jgi:hypothetical protein
VRVTEQGSEDVGDGEDEGMTCKAPDLESNTVVHTLMQQMWTSQAWED